MKELRTRRLREIPSQRCFTFFFGWRGIGWVFHRFDVRIFSITEDRFIAKGQILTRDILEPIAKWDARTHANRISDQIGCEYAGLVWIDSGRESNPDEWDHFSLDYDRYVRGKDGMPKIVSRWSKLRGASGAIPDALQEILREALVIQRRVEQDDE